MLNIQGLLSFFQYIAVDNSIKNCLIEQGVENARPNWMQISLRMSNGHSSEISLPKKNQESKARLKNNPPTFRGLSPVPCKISSCQSRICELPLAWVSCLCGFSSHDLDTPCSYDPSSLSSAKLQELSPVLGYGSVGGRAWQ